MEVIIVAGGAGTRMKTDVPKQFLEICGKPIILHAVMAFVEALADVCPVVVLSPSHTDRWQSLCREHNFTAPHRVVAGGETRFHSVKNGLAAIPQHKKGLVAVHDAVRPLVSRQTIEKCIMEATLNKCAVPSISLIDTVREVFCAQKNRMIDRETLRLIQTPQVFDVELLKKAYNQEYNSHFTDCASVFESAGNNIYLTEGNVENIKITREHDLIVAEALMLNQKYKKNNNKFKNNE